MQGFRHGACAVITGVGPGMGRALALGFAREGVSVVLAARDRARLERIAAEVRELTSRVLVVPTDLSRAEDCEALVDGTVATFGRLDHLVQNGHHLGPREPITESRSESWNQAFAVNLFGALHLVQAAAPAMEPGSSIVLVNSAAAIRNPPMMGAYAASKAALASLVRSAAVELGPKIRVNGVYLGRVTGPSFDQEVSAMAAQAGIDEAEYVRRRAARLPIGAIPSPEQCADAVLFLASDLASAVTGQHLAVNGGEWLT